MSNGPVGLLASPARSEAGRRRCPTKPLTSSSELGIAGFGLVPGTVVGGTGRLFRVSPTNRTPPGPPRTSGTSRVRKGRPPSQRRRGNREGQSCLHGQGRVSAARHRRDAAKQRPGGPPGEPVSGTSRLPLLKHAKIIRINGLRGLRTVALAATVEPAPARIRRSSVVASSATTGIDSEAVDFRAASGSCARAGGSEGGGRSGRLRRERVTSSRLRSLLLPSSWRRARASRRRAACRDCP